MFLDGYLIVEARTRYSVWDLLGDVGGFNDGLYLLVSLLIGPLGTFSFSKDYVES